MTKRTKLLVLAGLVFCLALAFDREFFVLHVQTAKEVSLVSPAITKPDNSPATNPSIAPLPPGIPQNPAQAEEFERQNLHYSPWPPKDDSSANADESKKKKP